MLLKKLIMSAAVFILVPGLSWAADYKKWLPYLPEKHDGITAVSKGEGMNMDSDGMEMSYLMKTYGTGKNRIDITITYDRSEQQNRATLPMMNMNIESDQGVSKTIEIQEYKAVFLHDKAANSVNIFVMLNDKTTVVMGTIGGKSQSHYVNLFKKISLSSIVATL